MACPRSCGFELPAFTFPLKMCLAARRVTTSQVGCGSVVGRLWWCRLALKHACIFMCLREHNISTFGDLSMAKTVLPPGREHCFGKSALFEKVTKRCRNHSFWGPRERAILRKMAPWAERCPILLKDGVQGGSRCTRMCSRGTKVDGKWHPKGQQATPL